MRLGSSQIICPNLREFEQMIVRNYLWDLPDQIKIGMPKHLSGQIGFRSGLS
jgi:hypothetical protein